MSRWTNKVWASSPVNQDVTYINVVRFDRETHEQEYATVGAGGEIEWHPYSGYDTIKQPFIAIDGLEYARKAELMTDEQLRLLAPLHDIFKPRVRF